jgi:hypothetical protein
MTIFLFVFVPLSHNQLIEEDGVLESVTAVLFLSCTAVSAVLLIGRHGIRSWYMTIPVLGAIGFLDELSFGERHLGVSMPQVVGKKLDGVHDLVDLTYEITLRNSSETVANIILALAVVSLFGIFLRYRREIARVSQQNPPLPYLLLCFFLLVPATLLDMHLFGKGPLQDFLEELLELNVALCMLFAAIAVGFTNRPEKE